MARFNSQKFRRVYVDNVEVEVPHTAVIGDLVSRDVVAVSTREPDGSSRLLSRREFDEPLPPGFTTHLTHIEKGYREVVVVRRRNRTRRSYGSSLLWWGFGLLVVIYALGQDHERGRRAMARVPSECLSSECVEAYGQFINSPSPHAFAVSENGGWGWASESTEPAAAGLALERCASTGGEGCRVVALGHTRID